MSQPVTQLVDITENNIFAFWESPNPIPAYLDLCRETWIKNIPNCKIHILNHANLHEYIGDTYDLEKLKTISFAMQSDIISAAVLEKFGGLFLDLDCIVIDDIFDIFSTISETKLISFGRADAKAIHLAVLFSRKPNNPLISEWRKGAQERLQNKPENYPWHYFGNGIIDPLLKKPEHKDDFYIIDRTQSGNILESAVFGSNLNRAIEDYKNLYFNEAFSFSPALLDKVNCGVISLHNSWSPPEYKNMPNKMDFLSKNVLISGMLNYILNNSTHKTIRNIFPIIESFIVKNLKERDIVHSLKYFRNMLVLDFFSKGNHFAFDISIKDDSIHLDFILRNISPEKVKELEYFSAKNFNVNKTRIISDIDQKKILDEIIKIHTIMENLNVESSSVLSNLPKSILKNSVVDLQIFRLIENILYIEGVGIITGQSAREYSDIDYKLIIKGASGEYVKNLGKGSRPELTKHYAAGTNFNYDKCWFATLGYKGIDISELPVGTYELFLKISVNGFEQVFALSSQKLMRFNNTFFSFEANSEGNNFFIKQELNGAIKKIISTYTSKLGVITQREECLDIHYKNGNHPIILLTANVMTNQIILSCDDKAVLANLYHHIGATNGELPTKEDTDLAKTLNLLSIEIEKFIGRNTKFSNSRLNVNGYYQDEYNNIIEAPLELKNVQVQFFGKNNYVKLHERSNLKNTVIEFKGDNASFSIGQQTDMSGTFRLGFGCHITIGNNTTSTNAVWVTCAEQTSIIIGDDCMFATNNQVRTDDSHAIYDVNTGTRVNPSKDIVIGNHVWVAYGATILGGSHIGNGSVIGAYSLVKKEVPNNCVAAGIPAKIIKKDIFWERPLLLNMVDETIFPSEYLELKEYIQNTEE
ncbi:acetyltransferase [Actinobacillus porcinus]|uniref:Acetyltransferase n=1 Tax=Actinobacillus porcinus TaxID=51048 RepID=A0ABY6TJ60_9PAST|nr:capsular polysaccharide synthesis protein [Actinobacillus porcinus]VFY92710.1 acetyltransferase [Actinobacillus porcinus]VTU06971.1 acetyltransferase [Actinobacillus porcinus]